MALTKETVIDKIEILEGGHLQVRRATYAVEDGKRIGLLKYHRSSYDPSKVDEPGHPRSIDTEDVKVKKIAKEAWTPAVIAAFEAHAQKG